MPRVPFFLKQQELETLNMFEDYKVLNVCSHCNLPHLQLAASLLLKNGARGIVVAPVRHKE